ncbi:TetR/AcrR family transcriptional regulator [Nocardiopsis composta]
MAQNGSTREPARRPGGRTARVRRRILEAAAELIARDGIGGLRYDQVAELAGVNKTSVYRNWPDRTALAVDALAAFSADAAPLHDSGDIDADLVDFLEALAAALSSPQGRALLSVVGAAHDNPDLRAVVDEAFAQRLTAVRRRVEAAIESGSFQRLIAVFSLRCSAVRCTYWSAGARASSHEPTRNGSLRSCSPVYASPPLRTAPPPPAGLTAEKPDPPDLADVVSVSDRSPDAPVRHRVPLRVGA